MNNSTHPIIANVKIRHSCNKDRSFVGFGMVVIVGFGMVIFVGFGIAVSVAN
jgi:hypothetical protein